MARRDSRTQSDLRIERLFTARAADRGRIVRRNVAPVESEIGHGRLIAEVRRRGFPLQECGP